MQDILKQVYQIHEKSNERQIWQQKGFGHATEPEKIQYQTPTQERQKHMKAIVSIDKKSTKLVKQNTLCKAFNAWKEANIFLKNEKPNIKWADRPVINLIPERKSKKHKRILEYHDTIRIHA